MSGPGPLPIARDAPAEQQSQEHDSLIPIQESASLSTSRLPDGASPTTLKTPRSLGSPLPLLCSLTLGLCLGIFLSPVWFRTLHSLTFLRLSPFPRSSPSLRPPLLPYADLPTLPPSTPSSPSARQVTFLVIGDWGRDGMYNQSVLAHSMGSVALDTNSSFVVSTGDNFYETGLQHEQDVQFDTSFTAVYSHPGLRQLNWYSILGNHDYVQNPEAQTGLGLRVRDPRWHCSRSYQLRLEPPCTGNLSVCRPLLELFFVDTTPLLRSEWGPSGQRPGARLNLSGLPAPDHETFTQTLTTALGESLAASDAHWKAVVGHHTLRSVGVHGDTPDLIQHLLPVMEANGADVYINGHDHCLQLIKRDDSPVYFATSGAGSKAYRGQRPRLPGEGVLFDYNGQGFMDVVSSEQRLSMTFRDVFGAALFGHELQK